MRLSTALGLILVLAAPAADAAIFVVNSTADAVDAVINGVCASAGGSCTLRAAIQEANSNSISDTIELPAGTYTLTIPGNDASAAMGDLDIVNPVAIEGAGADVTVIDAAGLDRVFEIPFSPGTFQVTLDSVTIRGGALTNAGGAGVVHSDDGTLVLLSVTITDNHVAGITSNAVGGALDVNGGGVATILDSLLADNSADRGGAIFTNSTLTLQDSTIAGNLARVGSAIESYGTTVVERSTISGNESTGGAIIDVATNQTSIRNSTLTGNTAASAAITTAGTAFGVENSTFFDNASYGTIRATSGTTEVTGTVLAGSIGVEECDADGGTLALLDYNLDDDGTCSVGSATSITVADPGLGLLVDNGGPTLTRAPRFGSPLLDAGATAPSCAGVDQRGLPRPVDAGGDPIARCDIGAVELAPEPAGATLAIASIAALALRRRRRSA
jgi:CSLREA domain-containing protein